MAQGDSRSVSLIKQRPGVLEYNVNTRNQLLIKNAKYSQYKETLLPAIGETYNISTKSVKDLTDGKGLLYYTHNEKKTDQNKIYSNVDTVRTLNWGGNYEDYTVYTSKIFSNTPTYFTFVNGILSNISTEYALRENEIGIVDHLNVTAGLHGAITTNPNNTSKLSNTIKDWGLSSKDLSDVSDTRIGIISSQLYPKMLYSSAVFNSTKKREEDNSIFSYITPSLFYQYGNNLSNLDKLSDILYIDSRTGRTRDDLGIDAKIIDNISENGEGIDTNAKIFLLDQFENYYDYNRDGSVYYPYADYITETSTVANDDAVVNGENNKKINKANFRENVEIAARVNHIAFNEGDNNSSISNFIHDADINQFDQFIDSNEWQFGKNNLLSKTNKLFKSHKIKTMMGRFHINGADSGVENNTIDTAWHDKFGNSHGRSLLKLDAAIDGNDYMTNGYENPYCRTWTYHHEYAHFKDTIRPFKSENEGTESFMSLNDIQSLSSTYRSSKYGLDDGGTYLSKNSVLQNNGLVKITPTVSKGETNSKKDKIKRCMFSIENLAWKGTRRAENNYHGEEILSKEQIGPNGGRIMWFPPYDLDFQENVNVEWSPNNFIGRGEKVYTYSNTDRTGQLSFTILIDHPSIINSVVDSKGQGQEQDINADILRFFAGCRPLDVEKRKPIKVENDNTPPKEETGEIPNEGKKIKFAVFFPNNYSGNMTDPNGSQSVNKSTWQTSHYLDKDWAEYISIGSTIDTAKKGYYNGYEICNKGISQTTRRYILAKKYKNVHGGKFDSGKDIKMRNALRYYYRVDFDLRQNGLKSVNYRDTKSYYLNSKLNEAASYYKSLSDKNVSSYSFSEFYTALKRLKGEEDTDITNYLVKNGARSSSIDELYDILKSNGTKIDSIKAEGCATKQDSGNSNLLATRRATTVGWYVSEMLSFRGTPSCSVIEPPIKFKKLDINSGLPKKQRSVIVTIEYNKPSISTVGNDEIEGVNSKGRKDYKSELKNKGKTDIGSTNNIGIIINGQSLVKATNIRYDDEYRFFRDLEITDPFIFKSICDKYKYFDPAFHSITPEGFNARLNFLHQCTRQGHTVSAVDFKNRSNIGNTAGNLAFGRMPVCVLRIGDFIYSRVLIQSMSLSYSENGMQWDLNPEGVGVQPMYARVNLGLIIIGGQALNSPVNRLQNAQTFNYYANTGVYDDRADRVTIDDNGKLSYLSLFKAQDEVDSLS